MSVCMRLIWVSDLALEGTNMARKHNTWLHAVRIALVAAGLLVFTAPSVASAADSPSQDAPAKAGESDPTNPIPWKT